MISGLLLAALVVANPTASNEANNSASNEADYAASNEADYAASNKADYAASNKADNSAAAEINTGADVVAKAAGIADITVTARRRTENVQDVPLSIAVVGGEALDARGLFNISRLTQIQPTIQFFSTNPRNTFINIRGIGAPFGLTNDGFEQGVGVYIDQVYYNRIASATLDFVDVEQIEVLRGPQGTLYGKNTTAGAINITTRAPSFDFEGRAEVSLGDYSFKQAKASMSGPLSDRLAARISVATTQRRGTIYNVATDSWINAQDNIGVRGALLWRPSETLDITLSGDFNRYRTRSAAARSMPMWARRSGR